MAAPSESPAPDLPPPGETDESPADTLDESPLGAFAAPPAAWRLPADLIKLRQRYLALYPHRTRRTDLLAHVPAALRHLLTLRLELARTDALPARYRNLAETIAANLPTPNAPEPTAPDATGPDAVDRQVIAYAQALRDADTQTARRQLPQLARYFTQAQIIELSIILTLERALTQTERVLSPPDA